MRKWGSFVLGFLVLVMVLTGCGSAAGDQNALQKSDNKGTAAVESKTELRFESSQSADRADSSAEAPLQNDGASDKNIVVESGGSDSSVPGAEKAVAGFTGSDIVAGLNKKLIYHANLNMEVNHYAKAQTEVRNMVSLSQGYIIEFNENTSQYEQGGTFVIKVPASGFSSFLSNLEKVKHEKLQRSIQGQDVSEEYVDLESRLKAKQLMETQYTEFMKKATKSSDLVAFANELGKIQEEIERIKGKMRYIDQNVSFSTVELRLYQTDASLDIQKKQGQDPLGIRANKALKGSLHALSVTFEWLVVILAGALPILVGAGIILWIVLAYRKRRRRSLNKHSRGVREGNQAQQPANTLLPNVGNVDQSGAAQVEQVEQKNSSEGKGNSAENESSGMQDEGNIRDANDTDPHEK